MVRKGAESYQVQWPTHDSQRELGEGFQPRRRAAVEGAP